VFAVLALTFAAMLGTSLLAVGQVTSTSAKIHVSPAKGSHPHKGCITSASVDAPTAQAGDRVRVKLSPARLGGN
jgi:hypothetical protein